MLAYLFTSICSVICVYRWVSWDIPYDPNMKYYIRYISTGFTMAYYKMHIADSYDDILVSTILISYNVFNIKVQMRLNAYFLNEWMVYLSTLFSINPEDWIFPTCMLVYCFITMNSIHYVSSSVLSKYPILDYIKCNLAYIFIVFTKESAKIIFSTVMLVYFIISDYYILSVYTWVTADIQFCIICMRSWFFYLNIIPWVHWN